LLNVAENVLGTEFLVEPPVSSRREEFTAHGTLVNRGGNAVTISLEPLASPSLAVEIVDAEGSPVLLPPPPVPGGEPRRAVLRPDGRYSVEFAGFVPQWTPPGTYRARLRYVVGESGQEEWTGRLVSDWAEFVIAAESSVQE
jgi:hypothetical protein